jgi:hypothetical protein
MLGIATWLVLYGAGYDHPSAWGALKVAEIPPPATKARTTKNRPRPGSRGWAAPGVAL